jgi:hypothetical protein
MACAPPTVASAATRGLEDIEGDTASLVRLRIPDARVQRAVAEGRRRSETFRNIIDALEHSRAFVYIVLVPYLPQEMEGCVPVDVAGAGEDRYLRVMIKSGLSIDRMISVIGHETQHVLEILGEAQNGSRNSGFHAPGAYEVASRHYETAAAADVGDRIAVELRQIASARN